MSLFVDTSVWSLAFRRALPAGPQVSTLRRRLEAGDPVFTTGIVFQELLQGFRGPKDAQGIHALFSALPFLVPDRKDHAEAAEIRNCCRRRGVQIGTIDALLAGLCLRHGLAMLTTDQDFQRIAAFYDLHLA